MHERRIEQLQALQEQLREEVALRPASQNRVYIDQAIGCAGAMIEALGHDDRINTSEPLNTPNTPKG